MNLPPSAACLEFHGETQLLESGTEASHPPELHGKMSEELCPTFPDRYETNHSTVPRRFKLQV